MRKMLRSIVTGVLGWGVPVGAIYVVATHALLGWPWPTGPLLTFNVIAWPVGGVIFGVYTYRWSQTRAGARAPEPSDR
jgi:hypothetical protein